MAADVTINRAAVRAILRSDEVRADLERRAERVASAAGPGHRVDSEIGPSRARAAVITTTFEAARRQALIHSLAAAVDAAR